MSNQSSAHKNHDRDGHASSTGHTLSATDWLDTHFEACRPEYEAMLRSTGIQSGWHVLDAGCGGGSYLPTLAELVGVSGRITALDLAPENIANVDQRLGNGSLPCPLDTRVGSLTALHFGDDQFDAVWCANVTQLLDEEQLLAALAEFRRVVRPGGLVAIKDVDMQLFRMYPTDQFLVSHLCEASITGEDVPVESRGSLRGRELRRWLERAGLVNVWQRTTLIERWAPLRPVEHRLFTDWLSHLATLAEDRGVPEADLPIWRSLREPNSPDNPINHPEYYACEGQAVAVGQVSGNKN